MVGPGDPTRPTQPLLIPTAPATIPCVGSPRRLSGAVVSEILDFIRIFSSVLWEAFPFIVLGAVVAGVLEEFLPQQMITRVLPRQAFAAVVIGALLGLVFPMCECGIVVVMRRLLRKGLPLACCVAYMLAGPIINLVVIFSTFVAFAGHGLAPEMVGMRVGLGFIVAVITGMVVHWQYRKHGSSLLSPLAIPHAIPSAGTPSPAPATDDDDQEGEEEPYSRPRKSLLDRLGNISATAIHDFVDITVFLILGAILAALAKSLISPGEIEQLSTENPVLSISAMMGLAFLMCLCSEADAFVAASFTSMHVSGKLAFLVLGPMLDIKLIVMYTRVFRPRLIITIILCVVTFVFLLCLAVHGIYQANNWSGLPDALR